MTDEVITPAPVVVPEAETAPAEEKQETVVDKVSEVARDAAVVYDDRSLFQKEPAVFIGAVASLVVALAAIFGVVIDVNALTGVLVSVAPVVTALLVRAHVIPAV